MPVSRQSLFRPALLLLGTLALQACAQQPTQPNPSPNAAQLTHACQPTETVGFSCELQDGQVLSLCASPGFNDFKGKPADNPGYAYVAITSGQGNAPYTYPPNPQDYKKHMYFWVSMSAAPHMFVSTEKGAFLHLSLDIDSPADVTNEYVPKGWPLASSETRSLCTSQFNRDHLDPFMAQMVKKADWEKDRQSTARKGGSVR
ncbi:MAG: hypothetical protein CVU22_10430 [Betaproteobacteria bacterium HGW-Betaproteobacteria-16]|nr:MAG: hypothetical protein CVU22_10430 [Betaproteobacteria bacterium HGW-Betaproteobacteria-16]